jgi:hypothetical protein
MLTFITQILSKYLNQLQHHSLIQTIANTIINHNVNQPFFSPFFLLLFPSLNNRNGFKNKTRTRDSPFNDEDENLEVVESICSIVS